jgi:hypothetical protein
MCLATTLTLIVGGVSTASPLTAMVVKDCARELAARNLLELPELKEEPMNRLLIETRSD